MNLIEDYENSIFCFVISNARTGFKDEYVIYFKYLFVM